MTGGAGIVRTQTSIDVGHVANSFIWASIGERLGYDTGKEAERYARALLSTGMDLEELESQASQWTAMITEQRQVTTGEIFQ